MTQPSKRPVYPWRRYWTRPGDRHGVALRGLFSFDIHTLGTAEVDGRRAVRLEDLIDVPAVLLRGAAQSGKSVAMRQAAATLAAEGRPVLEVDLAHAPEQIESHPHIVGKTSGLVVFVDGLDIAHLDQRSQNWLVSALGRLRAIRSASVRIAVRSGYHLQPLMERIAELYVDSVVELEIAPLRPEDVRLAARAHGVEPDFLRATELLQATPLTAQPVSLLRLLGRWKTYGRNPPRLTDLYADACEALVGELNPIRLGAGGGGDVQMVGTLSATERLAVISRLAAMMTFGGYAALDMGAAPAADALPLDKTIGGGEPTSVGEVAVGRAAVWEALRTGLFQGEGSDRVSFVHPSLREFLAAWFLLRRGVSPKAALSLLALPDGRVGANRISVASWFGALSSDFADCLIARDPQVLLRSGQPLVSEAARQALAAALLEESLRGPLDLGDELEESGNLLLVYNPGLKALLETVLTDCGAGASARSLACRIAMDAGAAPVAALLTIVEDSDQDLELRCEALLALKDAKDLPEPRLRALLGRIDPSDPQGRLRGLTLALAYKRFLTPAETILLMMPGETVGSTQQQLSLELLRALDERQLPTALDALALAVSRATVFVADLRLVASGLAQLAFARLHDPAVRVSLARMIRAVPPFVPWCAWSDPLETRGFPVEASRRLVRGLVQEIVEGAASVEEVATMLEIPWLILDEDAAWIAGKALEASGTSACTIWSTLLVAVVIDFGGLPASYLLNEGFLGDEARRIVERSERLASRYTRWRRPNELVPEDAQAEGHGDEHARHDEGDYDVAPESLLVAAKDHRFQQLQAEAGGRGPSQAVPPATLLALVERSERRLVQNDLDLLAVAKESLTRLEARLKGRDPLVRALWNEEEHWGDFKKSEKTGAYPKDENFLSDFVVDHFRRDLVDRGIVADREVTIRERLAQTKGQRTDIQIQAFRLGADDQPAIASLIVEVKGCWNPAVRTALRKQLVEEYLVTTRGSAGLYLVGWYVCDSWPSAKRKIGAARAEPADRSAFEAELVAQASAVTAEGKVWVEAMLLDATLA